MQMQVFYTIYIYIRRRSRRRTEASVGTYMVKVNASAYIYRVHVREYNLFMKTMVDSKWKSCALTILDTTYVGYRATLTRLELLFYSIYEPDILILKTRKIHFRNKFYNDCRGFFWRISDVKTFEKRIKSRKKIHQNLKDFGEFL